MLTRLLIVAAVLASTAAAPAHAAIKLNGFTLNGWPLNGAINVGGHHGVGLNGQVLAIEF